MKKIVYPAIVVLALITLFLVLRPSEIITPTSSAPEEPSGVPVVRVTEAAKRDIEETMQFHGRFAANAQVSIVPKVSGRIGEVHAKIGDTVQEDEVLFRIETDELSLQLKQAEAALLGAEASLAKIKSGARAEEIEQAEASLRQAEANLKHIQLNYERSKKLYEQGVISGSEWNSIQAQYEVAQAQLVTAEKSLALVKEGSRKEDIMAAEAAVAQAMATLDLARLNLNNASIKSPISGQLSRIAVERGTMVSPGMTVATVVDIDTIRFDLQVTGREVTRLRRGQPVTLTVDALPEQAFSGTIGTISPAADEGSGLFSVKVEAPNEGHYIKPGMYGSVQVIIGHYSDGVVVPSQALLEKDNRKYVYLVDENNVAHLVQVEVGIRNDGLAQIRSGLSIGDLVVIAGKEAIDDGVTVQVNDRGEVQ